MVKNPLANAGVTRGVGLLSGLEWSARVENGNPLQYSCLGSSVDRGAWQGTIHAAAKCQTQLSMQAHSRAALPRCVINSFCCKAVNRLCMYVYPLLFGFLSHLGHNGAWRRAPMLYSRLSLVIYFMHNVHICQSQSPSSSHPCFPSWSPYICLLPLCLYFCFANRFICST